MAELEPSDLFAFGLPAAGSVQASKEVRDNFTALARNNYTSDSAKPLAPQDGMARVNVADLNNIKLEFFLDGAWRLAVQNLQTSVPVPTKRIFEVPSGSPLASWVVDHNLGSRVTAQVFTSSWFQMNQIDQFPEEIKNHGRVDLSVLAPGPVVTGLPFTHEGSFLNFFGVTLDGISGAGVAASFQWEVDQTPSGGGVVPVGGGPLVIPPGPHPAGTVFPGPAVVAPNTFSGQINSPADVMNIIASGVTAGVGSVELYAQVNRTLGPGEFRLEQPTDNRIVVTHPEPRSGFVVLVG